MAPPYFILGNPKDYPPAPIIRPASVLLLGLLENCSLEKLNTINPCLAIIFKASTTDTAPESLAEALQKSYTHDPVTTLKLMCFLRGWGWFGREGFIKAALWLHQHHPLTLACNISVLGGFGWLTDLLEILYRVLQGSIAEIEKKSVKKEKRKSRAANEEDGKETEDGDDESKKLARRAKEIAMAKAGLQAYYKDNHYRYLHNRITDFFAAVLKSDLKSVDGGEIGKISVAAKFCPSINSSYDKATLVCESIARKVFPRDEYTEYRDIEEAHYAYRVRNRLQKEVLVPLRKVLNESKEIFIFGVERQDSTFVALKALEKLIVEPDEKKKLQQYLKIVARYGKSNVEDGLLLPHEVFIMMRRDYEVAELHWQILVGVFSKNEKLKSCIAVCDISEGISGTIMEEFCVSMGLLISETSSDPWKGKIFTFGDHPRLFKINGDNLGSKSGFIRELDYGEGFSFVKIYDRILQVVMTEKISQDRKVRRIFVFTYQDFDKSMREKWVADYKEAWKSYRKRGYKTVPEIIFWNPKGSRARHEVINSPVDNHHRGIVVVNGFSRNLINMFLMGDYHSTKAYTQQQEDLKVKNLVPDIEDLLGSAISRDEFKNLAVMD